MRWVSVRRSSVAVAVAAVLVAGMSVSAAATQPGMPFSRTCGGDENLDSYRVRLSAVSDVVSLTQSARIRVRVHRVVAGSDLGPVEDVIVGISLTNGDVMRAGSAITGEAGVATVKIQIDRQVPVGFMDGFAYAYKEVAEVPCFRSTEHGSAAKNRLIRVVR